MKYSISIFILYCSICTIGWSQSLIFSGGSGDGTATSCFLESEVFVFGVYTGGNEDGVSFNCFLQNNVNVLGIYGGGNEDGMDVSCYSEQLQNSSSFFFGGSNSGTALNCYTQNSVNSADFLYFGGVESGDAFNCFLQPSQLSAGIYSGGINDGFDVYCFTQNLTPTFSLFNGGVSDGASIYCYLQQAPTGSGQIYSGGVNDGFDVNCYLQMIPVGYSPYNGGINDGFDVNCHLQIIPIGSSLFNGGINDGFDINCFVQTDFLVVVLPIELTAFTATLNTDRNVDLFWETATEYNSDYFVVERSTNLFDWEEIAEVGGAGTSTEPLEYYHEDTDPKIGDNYYRIKQVDFNGDFNFSHVVPVTLDGNNTNPLLLIYPNPVTDLLNIQLSDYEQGEYSIEIYNDLGQMIYTKSIMISNETEIYQINREPNMISGFYIILTNSKETNERKSERIIFN